MVKLTMLSDEVPYWKFMVATRDEEEIERRPPGLQNDNAVALRWIDEAQKRGTYNDERAEFLILCKEFLPSRSNSSLLNFFQNDERGKRLDLAFQNICLGLESPDLHQRARFKSFVEYCDKNSLRLNVSLLPILEVIEPSKRVKGRKKRKGPSKDDYRMLSLMKVLVHSGSTPAAAALRVATNNAKPHYVEALRKRLERWWRWKMAHRQIMEE